MLAIFHYLTVALLRSEERADQLEARSIQLANLQLGVLEHADGRARAARSRRPRRHAAAVARYAKALAHRHRLRRGRAGGVHTAGLLHDIGKFTWSDRILHPEQLTDEDWAVIRRHPQDGATLVGKLDGYGPVADAILYHHERIDGGGYPAGLIGNEIPLASRIVAICSTYDTMTARDHLPLADDARGRDRGAAQNRRHASSTPSSSRASSRCSSARAPLLVARATPTSRPSSRSSGASRTWRSRRSSDRLTAT